MNIVIMMITGSIVGVAYITENYLCLVFSVEYEQYAFLTEQQDRTGHIGQ
jgi:molybdopterin-containing oxidoreductase family membrane subunit